MDRRPLIGLITQVQETQAEPDPLAVVTHNQYVRAIEEAGAAALLVPLLTDEEARLRECFDRLDGLFLTGGTDIDPVHYGEARHPLCEKPDPERDRAELLLFQWARADRLPVLGICRGLQLINAALGGTLHQDLAVQRPESIKHDYFSDSGGYPRDRLSHEVSVQPASQLGKILGQETWHVNSMHHQGIRTLADGLISTAFAPDGLIEGVESAAGGFLIAVQWHPEELTDNVPGMRRLFGGFVQAASGTA